MGEGRLFANVVTGITPDGVWQGRMYGLGMVPRNLDPGSLVLSPDGPNDVLQVVVGGGHAPLVVATAPYQTEQSNTTLAGVARQLLAEEGLSRVALAYRMAAVRERQRAEEAARLASHYEDQARQLCAGLLGSG